VEIDVSKDKLTLLYNKQFNASE